MENEEPTLAKNPGVDAAVVAEFRRLESLTEGAIQPRKGADYRLAPPLSTTIAFSPNRRQRARVAVAP